MGTLCLILSRLSHFFSNLYCGGSPGVCLALEHIFNRVIQHAGILLEHMWYATVYFLGIPVKLLTVSVLCVSGL